MNNIMQFIFFGLSASRPTIQGGPKKQAPNILHITSSNLDRFQNYFTVAFYRKFATLNIPPHLKRFAKMM